MADLRCAHLGPCQLVSRVESSLVIPEDVYYTIFMGSDIGHLPQDSLVNITGLPEQHEPAQKAYIQPGDFCVVAGKDRLPIVLGVLMELVTYNGEEQGLFLGCRKCLAAAFVRLFHFNFKFVSIWLQLRM